MYVPHHPHEDPGSQPCASVAFDRLPTSGLIARTGVVLARKQQPDVVRSPVDHGTLPVVSCVPDRFCPVVTAVREQSRSWFGRIAGKAPRFEDAEATS
jgi:hypothetical protein